MTTITIGAADYGRISSDPGFTEKGVTRQSQDSRERIAREPGWHHAGSFIDNDLSATKGAHRPQFERLMNAVRRSEVKVIVCYMTGRLVRNRRERVSTYEELAEHGVKIVCTGGQSLDLSTSSGRALAGILGEIDAMEVEQMSERLKRSRRQAAEEGRPAGRNCYGYAPDPAAPKNAKRRLLVPEEVAVVEDCRDRVLAGESLRSIVLDLNEDGVPSPGSAQWKISTLKKVLLNPGIAGRRVHHGKDFGPAVWEPIVSDEEFERLKRILMPHAQPEGWSNRHKWLLSGIALCGKCALGGKRVRVVCRVGRGGRPRAYECPDPVYGGCRGVRRNADMVDRVVERTVLRMLATPGVVEALLAASAPDAGEVLEVQRGIEACQARADALGVEMAGDDPADEVTKIMRKAQGDKIRADLAALRARQAQMSRSTAVDGLLDFDDIGEYWPGLPLARKRAIVAAMVEVTVLPVGKGHRATEDHIRIVERVEPA